MLPAPVTYHAKRVSISRNHRSLSDVLLSRARVTNLGLCILIASAALSVLVNLGYFFAGGSSSSRSRWNPSLPEAILATVARDVELQKLDHLVIVPGHAIWTGSRPGRVLDAENWLLEPYQNTPGRIEAFYNHIVKG